MKFHGNIGVVGNKILPDICVAVIKYLGIVYKISPKYWGAGDKILSEYLEE